MKQIKFFLVILFDIIDTYYHQIKILKALKKFNLNINYFIDVGACNGKYTDLIINNFQVKHVLMFEPNKFFYHILYCTKIYFFITGWIAGYTMR